MPHSPTPTPCSKRAIGGGMSDRPTAYGLEYDDSCQSCGAELEWCDDNRCRGCGLMICEACVTVFEHIDETPRKGMHGTGDPVQAIDAIRKAGANLLDCFEAFMGHDADRFQLGACVKDLREAMERGRHE